MLLSLELHLYGGRSLLEFPYRPATYLNRPTSIGINGRISYYDTELRAGHRRAAGGWLNNLLLTLECPTDDGATDEASFPLLIFVACVAKVLPTKMGSIL
jgi:hypothetical protein